MFSVDRLDYTLPGELIAQAPLRERDASRLLVVDRTGIQAAEDTYIKELPTLLPPSLFVFNESKVFPARLTGVRVSEGTAGGNVEVLLIERLDFENPNEMHWLAWGKPGKSLRVGSQVSLCGGRIKGQVTERYEDGSFAIVLKASAPIEELIDQYGQLALPPYIDRTPSVEDKVRYQTLFALNQSGLGRSVAAPTAGLHFSAELLEQLRQHGHRVVSLSLHVGAGTFAPLRSAQLDEHKMHVEHYVIPSATARAIQEAKAENRSVVAVGTTVVRALESEPLILREVKDFLGSTNIFIKPPFEFKVIDAMVTNFHLPRSTLLALVMAFAGIENIQRAYQSAVGKRYRFFSYGDAMLIKP